MSPKLSPFSVSVAILLCAAAAYPQCNYQFQYSGEFRASILDVRVDGNNLWAATGYGLQLYDRAVDPPKLVASTGLPGVTSIVRAAQDTAYAGGTTGITVLRHTGSVLKVLQTVSVTGLNDLVFTPATIYAATTSGIVAFNTFDMSQSPVSFPTSSPAVSSLSMSGSTLYAADGDSTVEVFGVASGTSPQKLGTITTSLRATSVTVTGSRLYVSDGLRTEIFGGTGASFTSLGILPYPSRSLADVGANVVMIAGNDRRLRAIDTTVPQSFIELFDAELPPSGGTVNRVTSIQTAGSRVYVGAGDIGLASYDVSHFGPPYPMRAYAIGATGSIVALPAAFYAARASGGIQEMTRSSSGGLTLARIWDAQETPVVQDAAGAFLLSSSTATLTMWFLGSTIPTSLSTATFATSIRSAVLNGTASAIVLLQDGTLWTVDLSQATGTPVRVASGLSSLAFLAHSTGGTAGAEVSSDATVTTVHFWSGDLKATPVDVRVPGSATALALNGSTAAVFTFRGITTVDFSTSSQTLLPGSNAAIANGLAISGGKVVQQTPAGTIRIWDIGSGALQNEFVIPGGTVAMDTVPDSTTVAVATGSGVASVDFGVSTAQPLLTGRLGANAYYKKAVLGGAHLYLFDGVKIDVYNLQSTTAPEWSASIAAAGTLDLAASNTALYTLSNSEVVTEYSSAGVMLRSNALNEGTNVTPLAIETAGGVPWVAFSRGCTTTGCEKRTDVLDPQSLVSTASLPGGVVDVTTNLANAYAIFDLPAEIRIYDIGDPLHPSPTATTPNDTGAIAIAYNPATTTVYALGDRAYAFADRTLTAAGSQLGSQKPAALAEMLIDSGCAAIAGRSSAIETYALPGWSAANTIPVPGNVRSMIVSSGRLVILTDDSIEVWSRTAATVPVRRRGARP